jgi:hypothetical protein
MIYLHNLGKPTKNGILKGERKMKKEFRSFAEARKFVHSLNLKTQQEWRKYCKSNKKPIDIPSQPDRTYKNKGWNGMGDWLGTGVLKSGNQKFRSFTDAKKFVQSLGLKSGTEWNKFCKSGNKPKNIPASPNTIYKKEWISWGDWLNTGNISMQKKQYRSFEEAQKFVQKLGLKGYEDWKKYCKSGNKPDNIPTNIWNTYKKEWKGHGDFFGTAKLSNVEKSKIFLPFDEARIEARKLARKYKLKSIKDWKKAVKEGKIPKNLPVAPWMTYKRERNEKKV